MGNSNSKPKKPRGFPEATRAQINEYLNKGNRGVCIDYTIDGEVQCDGMICWTCELDDVVKKCEGRKVDIAEIEWIPIGNTCDFLRGWDSEY
jgi:hypothetical protein